MKLAVVTGVARASGIGHAICTALLDNGFAVIGVDKHNLDAASPLPTNHHFRFRTCRVDANAAKLRQHLTSALEELGSMYVDVVVNNAGIANPDMNTQCEGEDAVNEEDMSEEKEIHRLETRLRRYDNYIQTNLRSAFLVTEVCKPFFAPPAPRSNGTTEPSSSIINISSVHAHASEMGPSCSQEGYASAKSGMIGLTHAQGQALAGKARVNAILPGWIDTRQSHDPVPSDESHAWHTVGRVGKPEDIANMVAFLADGERSGFVTCQELIVDGGVSKRMHYV